MKVKIINRIVRGTGTGFAKTVINNDLENSVNEFLSNPDIKIVDIKYSVSDALSGQALIEAVVIIYEDIDNRTYIYGDACGLVIDASKFDNPRKEEKYHE